MRLLFVHQNFPGQFRHLALALAQKGHEVLALTASTNKNPISIPVGRYPWQPKAYDRKVFGFATTYAEMTERAQVVALACSQLKKQKNFVPDVILGHLGWGETLFLKEVWPDTRLLIYAEFFYRSRNLDTDFDPEFYKEDLAGRMWVTARQAHLLQAIHSADELLCPTHWQADTLPSTIRHLITVVHDGIDTDRVCPTETATVSFPNSRLRFEKGQELLSFVNRNLEPYRGYHIFMRALPQILKERPEAHVVLVGGEGQSYGPRPSGSKSWKDIFLEEVRDQLDLHRVHFVGNIPYATFVDLMRVTRVHAYLSYPFVLSWSMLEAMAAGALVVGSRTPPVIEVLKDGVNGKLVDFFDVEGWSNTLVETLQNPTKFDDLRACARKTIEEQYDLRSKCLPRLIEFVEGSGPSPLLGEK